MRGLFFAILLSLSNLPARAADPDPVLFLGSSTVQFWETIITDFPDHKAINRGVWGSVYADILDEVPELVTTYPDVKQILLYSGDNDIANGGTPEAVAEIFRRVAVSLHEKFPQAKMHVVSVKPSLARVNFLDVTRKANILIEADARDLGYVNYIDTHTVMLDEKALPRKELYRPDGLHMIAPGYAMWKTILTPALARCDRADAVEAQAEQVADEIFRQHVGVASLSSVPDQAKKEIRSFASDYVSFCQEDAAIATGTKALVPGTESIKGLHEAVARVQALRARVQQRYPALLARADKFGASDRDAVSAAMKDKSAGEMGGKLALEAESGRQHLVLLARKLLSLDQDLSIEARSLISSASSKLGSVSVMSGGESIFEKDIAAIDRLDSARLELGRKP
ncbi:MAG: hypothetical protein ACXVB9_17430 [Bdellovibrionota bacterium]